MTSTPEPPPLDVEAAVRDRYTKGALERQEALCCPTVADPESYAFLPREVIEKDYGCGDPTRYVREGDVVLDLGSGAGRVCYAAARKVGARGRVIGVDMNDEMLAVAEKYRDEVAAKLGYSNVEFRKGRIQDLALDMAEVERHLVAAPVRDARGLLELEARLETMRRERPMIADGSVDLVVSNCVLNLVRDDDKRKLFREIHRVLRRGGRVAISDIVVDEDLPPAMKGDPELWSGCLSGAMREDLFLEAFEGAGFHGIELAERSERPWRTLQGYEFRSVTVTARKGKDGPCFDHRQAVIYRGPWKRVEDDDGHVLPRGRRVAVCEKTYRILTAEPYGDSVIPVDPLVAVAPEEARPFPCTGGVLLRHPRETKGEEYRETLSEDSACGPGTSCC